MLEEKEQTLEELAQEPVEVKFLLGKTLTEERYNEINLEIAKLQMMFNNKTNGECWVSGVSKYGKDIDWMLCIKKEIGEAIDSFPWKHWKNIAAEPDIENVKIEMTDIYHFIMSEILRLLVMREASLDEATKAKELEKIGDIFMVATNAIDPLSYHQVVNEQLNSILNAENADSLTPVQTLDFLIRAWFKSELNIMETYASFVTLLQFMEEHFDFGFEELYKLYIGKNCLNTFRQDNGYKEGTYIKVWNGYEDNVHLQEVIKHLENNSKLNFENLYAGLTELYSEVPKEMTAMNNS